MEMSMQHRPIAGASFGVEILGFDPAASLSDDDVAELNALFDRHRLLLFRGGDVGAEAHVALVNAIEPVVREGAGEQLYSINSTTRKDAYIPGRAGIPFHADYLFTDHGPVQVVSLAALELELDEPTRFADNVAAARRLTPAMRARLEGMVLVHCQSWATDEEGNLIESPSRMHVSDMAHLPPNNYNVGRSPALVRHPRTGETTLMHSPIMTSHVEGMSNEASEAFFDELQAFQFLPEDCYTHAWKEGDLVIWDNIALQHGRPAIREIGERMLRRVAGNRVSVAEVMAGVVPQRAANVTAPQVVA